MANSFSSLVLGLRDDDGNPDNSLQVSRFSLKDNFSTDISFFEEVGVLPWRNGEPNDADSGEDCVE